MLALVVVRADVPIDKSVRAFKESVHEVRIEKELKNERDITDPKITGDFGLNQLLC